MYMGGGARGPGHTILVTEEFASSLLVGLCICTKLAHYAIDNSR